MYVFPVSTLQKKQKLRDTAHHGASAKKGSFAFSLDLEEEVCVAPTYEHDVNAMPLTPALSGNVILALHRTVDR